MEPATEGSGCAPEERSGDYLLFEVEGCRYALPVSDVREVLPAVEVDRLPGAAGMLLGMVTVRGHLLPVLDTRSYLGAPPRPTELRDHFLLAETGGRPLVVPCDRVLGLARLIAAEGETDAERTAAGDRIAAVVRDDEGLVLVPELRTCLPAAEAA